MTPDEERRRRRLDWLVAAWNKDADRMRAAMAEPVDDEQPDEGEDPTPRSTT